MPQIKMQQCLSGGFAAPLFDTYRKDARTELIAAALLPFVMTRNGQLVKP